MARTLLLTGRPGVGKTTVIKAVVQALGKQADGFYTEEIRERGRRQGFRLVGLRGERGVLAHVKFKGRGRPRVGRYGVDVSTVDRIGATAIERAVGQGRTVIIDEIGKMELLSPQFREAVWQAIDSGKRVLGTIMLNPHLFADKIKHHPQAKTLLVTRDNRNQVLGELLNWLAEGIR